ARGEVLLDEGDDVLTQPPEDGAVIPDQRAQKIKGPVAELLEEPVPVVEKLLVDVVVASLVRDGGRKQHQVRVPHQRLDEGGRSGRAEVLGNLQADDQIEAAAKVEPFFQIEVEDCLLGNLGEFAVQPLPLDTLKVCHAEPSRHGQPGSHATADIK